MNAGPIPPQILCHKLCAPFIAPLFHALIRCIVFRAEGPFDTSLGRSPRYAR